MIRFGIWVVKLLVRNKKELSLRIIKRGHAGGVPIGRAIGQTARGTAYIKRNPRCIGIAHVLGAHANHTAHFQIAGKNGSKV